MISLDPISVRQPSILDYRSILSGPQSLRVKNYLKDQMHTIATGPGGVINCGEWLPEVLSQRGLECQTLTLLNGIQAIGGKQAIEGLDPDELRREAQEFSSSGSFSMMDIGYVLQGKNKVIVKGMFSNPLQELESLYFSERRFLGRAEGSAFHIYCLLPVKNPADERFILKVDSLGGKQEYLSIDDFFEMMFGRNLFTTLHSVFEVP